MDDAAAQAGDRSEQRQIELRIVQSITDIPRNAWDRLLRAGDRPFLSWTFLEALERTGCVAPDRGWLPFHLTAWSADDDLIAAAPAYIKNDGMGDFSRDWAFGDAVRAVGGRFYPKLVVGVPFSPVTGRRILAAADVDPAVAARLLVQLAAHTAREIGVASVHVLYHSDREASALATTGLSQRVMVQYHWHNYDYRSPDDWLARLRSKRRTQCRRERREPARQGIAIRTVRGREIAADPERWAETAFRLYCTTCDRYMWGGRYLNREMFSALFTLLGNEVELVVAEREDRVVAGAINLRSDTHLYGRYWGCHEHHRFLHFNVCLYHSIDECIERGVQVFEGGAGGEHKISRGFEPAPVYSSHLFMDEKLNQLLGAALKRDAKRHLEGIEAWRSNRTQLG
ncbi:MAG: GNAT family N-acetyltransferase [Acidobacteria bacterium]|nr:GNAT family N-acetyltransferase [Acidobacteriota bacterium]